MIPKKICRVTGKTNPVKICGVFTKKREVRFRDAEETVTSMKVKNIKWLCLIIAIVSFAIGFSDFQENIFFWLGRPVGAIALIVWMIFMILEKESDILDEQERVKLTKLKIR